MIDGKPKIMPFKFFAEKAIQIKEFLKGNSGVKMKLFWMIGLCTMFQFLITLYADRFLQIRYFTLKTTEKCK